METKKIGNYFGANYAYAIKYLHKALKYIQDRERNDFIKISAYLRKDVSALPNIDLILMDWKFNNKVREITDRQAKRFANYLSEMKDLDLKSQEIIINLDWVKNNNKGEKMGRCGDCFKEKVDQIAKEIKEENK